MSNYNFNLFVDWAEMGLTFLKPNGTYMSALTGSGLTEKDIKRALKELSDRGLKATYSNFHRNKFVHLHRQ